MQPKKRLTPSELMYLTEVNSLQCRAIFSFRALSIARSNSSLIAAFATTWQSSPLTNLLYSFA